MKKDVRLEKLLGEKVVIVDPEHPHYQEVGKAVKFTQTAVGDFGLIIKLENDFIECFVFDKKQVKKLISDDGEHQDWTEEEIIEQLAACNYVPSQIAVYLDKDVQKFLQEFQNPTSEVYLSYTKGRLVADFEINQKLLENAKSGNITAAQIYEKNRESVKLQNLKDEIYFGHDT